MYDKFQCATPIMLLYKKTCSVFVGFLFVIFCNQIGFAFNTTVYKLKFEQKNPISLDTVKFYDETDKLLFQTTHKVDSFYVKLKKQKNYINILSIEVGGKLNKIFLEDTLIKFEINNDKIMELFFENSKLNNDYQIDYQVRKRISAEASKVYSKIIIKGTTLLPSQKDSLERYYAALRDSVNNFSFTYYKALTHSYISIYYLLDQIKYKTHSFDELKSFFNNLSEKDLRKYKLWKHCKHLVTKYPPLNSNQKCGNWFFIDKNEKKQYLKKVSRIKKTYLYFWSVHCPFDKQRNSELVNILANKAEDYPFEIIAICINSNIDEWKKYNSFANSAIIDLYLDETQEESVLNRLWVSQTGAFVVEKNKFIEEISFQKLLQNINSQ